MLKQKFLIDFGSKFGAYLLTAVTGILGSLIFLIVTIKILLFPFSKKNSV